MINTMRNGCALNSKDFDTELFSGRRVKVGEERSFKTLQNALEYRRRHNISEQVKIITTALIDFKIGGKPALIHCFDGFFWDMKNICCKNFFTAPVLLVQSGRGRPAPTPPAQH
ncbi:hypothetical protein [Pseudomonas sp. CES]|uniref:hypothetical protein n=1 Tax=Pseudomonas sp. CES TaxID=2719586 RepID=UPI00146FD084|nr:hypothetical protein [Pseudomonas sp. CES]